MKSRKNTRLRTKTRKRRQTRTRKRRQRGSAKKVVFKRTQKVGRFVKSKDGTGTFKLTISYETAYIPQPCKVCLPDEANLMDSEIVENLPKSEEKAIDIQKEIIDEVSKIFTQDISSLKLGGFFAIPIKDVSEHIYTEMFGFAEKLKEAVAQLMYKPKIVSPLPQTIYRTLLKILHQGDHIPDPKIRDMNAALIHKMIAIYIKNLTSDHLAYQRKGQSSHS
jgi:hypothetical protein